MKKFSLWKDWTITKFVVGALLKFRLNYRFVTSKIEENVVLEFRNLGLIKFF